MFMEQGFFALTFCFHIPGYSHDRFQSYLNSYDNKHFCLKNNYKCLKKFIFSTLLFLYLGNLVAKAPCLNLGKKLSNLLSNGEVLN